MGLEAVNFLFSTDWDIKELLSPIENIEEINNGCYIYKVEEKYCIDLQLMNDHNLSVRITMCNPLEEVTEAFIELCQILLKEKGLLYNYNYKISIEQMNEVTEKVVKAIFSERKKLFNSMYGDVVKAIGSDEFFKELYKHENKK